MPKVDIKFTRALLAVYIAIGLPSILVAQTLLVSTSTSYKRANAASSAPSINTNGRYIAFQSEASTLVNGDTNGVADIFLTYQDFITENGSETRETLSTTRVSVASDGSQANGPSFSPSIARDAERFVAFASSASNLVPGDSNGKDDIFIRDSLTSQTYRISVPLDAFGNVSGEANGDSSSPNISSDGCYVVFASRASNLNALDNSGSLGSDTNGKQDIFLYYNPLGLNGCNGSVPFLEIISIGVNNTQADGDSYAPVFGDIRFISFTSTASNLVSNDNNGLADIFLRDRAVMIAGQQVDRVTILASKSTNGTQANGESFTSSMAGSAAVYFDSNASNLVSDDTNGKRDIFKYTISGGRETGITSRASVSATGEEADGDSSSPSVAGGENYLAFASNATNLAGRSDCNQTSDIFVWDYVLNQLRRVNLSTSGFQSGLGLSSSQPSLAYGALLVAYQSNALLIPNDDNSLADIYISVASEDPNSRDNPLSRNEKLDEKPDICVQKNKASIFMEFFSSVAESKVNQSSASKKPFNCKGGGLCYQVTATPIKPNGKIDLKRDIRKETSKKNQIALSRLRPGNYSVSYKVVGKSGSSTIASKPSPKNFIVVRK
jgi:hypothetical protein